MTYIITELTLPASVSLLALGVAVVAMAIFAIVGVAKFVIHLLP